DADTGRELLFLRGHRKRIHQVAFSADGKRLASCSRDGSVKIWDAHFGTEARMVQGHTGALLTMAFSGDGGLLATAAKDRTIKLWDMQRWNPGDLMPPVRPLPNFDGLIYSLALQGTGERLAVCYFQKKQYPGLVHVWDVASGKQTFELKGEPAFRKVVFSPDGRHLALDGPERTVSIWDLSTRKSAPALKKGRGEPLDLAYSPDGSRVASAEGEGIIKVWDCETGELVHELQGHRHGKLRVGFCPKGRYLASAGEDSHLILWDPATGKEIRKLKHDGPLHSLAISPDGLRVAVACADSSVQIWEVTTGQRTLRLRVPGRPVYEVRFSPDGHRLAALVGGDAALRIWDASPMP
ncbi:MAG TPA: WD40 repeat domain-containing protein, partial [Gemmataceae bacterium]|nr:WD40 repeat domain-containing protein [Gemmataceae bacterium]